MMNAPFGRMNAVSILSIFHKIDNRSPKSDQKKPKNMKIWKKEKKWAKMAWFRMLKFLVLRQSCPGLHFIGSRMEDFAKKRSQKVLFLRTFAF